MTEKKFTIHNRGLQGQFIKENGEVLTIDMVCEMLNDFYEENEEIVELLNKQEERIKELEKENEQLKQEYNKLKHRHSLLHDVCIEAECDRDSYYKDVLSLEKENEQLKKQNRSLIIELDAHKHIQHTKYEQIKKENEQLESDLQMSREKALYWRNKAENLFGDMRTNVELTRENKQLKNELKELEKAVK